MSVTSEWRGIRVRMSLFKEIEHFLINQNATKYGTPKYDSKADFVEKACIMLLEKERSREKEKLEVAAR